MHTHREASSDSRNEMHARGTSSPPGSGLIIILPLVRLDLSGAAGGH
jgi:hypothetical protein